MRCEAVEDGCIEEQIAAEGATVRLDQIQEKVKPLKRQAVSAALVVAPLTSIHRGPGRTRDPAFGLHALKWWCVHIFLSPGALSSARTLVVMRSVGPSLCASVSFFVHSSTYLWEQRAANVQTPPAPP